MLRVMHASVFLDITAGKIHQLTDEQSAAVELGIPWQTLVMTPRTSQVAIPSEIGLPSRTVSSARTQSNSNRLYKKWVLRRFVWNSSFDNKLNRGRDQVDHGDEVCRVSVSSGSGPGCLKEPIEAFQARVGVQRVPAIQQQQLCLAQTLLEALVPQT